MIPIYKAIIDDNNIGMYGISLVEQPAMEHKFIALSQQEEDRMSDFNKWIEIDKSLLTDINNIKDEEGYIKNRNGKIYYNKEKGMSIVDVVNDLNSKKKSNTKITYTSQEEKRIVTGVLLEPHKLIYRSDEISGEEFYITMDEETIWKMNEKFFKNSYHHNSNIEHDENEIIDGVYIVEAWVIEDPNNDKANALGLKNLVKGSLVVSMKIENDYVWEEYIKGGKVLGFSMEAIMGLINLEKK